MNNYIRVLGENMGDIVLRPVLSPFSEAKSTQEIRALEAKGAFGCLQLQEIAGNDYLIRYHNYFLNQDDSLTFTGEKPILRLFLSLKYSFHYTIYGLGENVLHERGFNIGYLPQALQSFRLCRNKHYALMEIQYSLEYLQRLVPYFPGVEKFLQETKKQQPIFLSSINQVASTEMLAIIQEALYCSYPAVIRKKYLSYKVMEILILALQKITRHPVQEPVNLPEKVISKTYEASQLLSKDMARNYTMEELSAIVDLSIYNLKKGFKAIYGLTVMDFLHETRMQKARLLLSETDLPVSRIATVTGYKHPFAFSSAFKKYFGYAPSLVQKSRKQTFAYN